MRSVLITIAALLMGSFFMQVGTGLLGTLTVIGTLISDLLLALVDPRIRYA